MNSGEAERQLLRRIAICFVIVVVTMPLTMFGGHWNWILLANICIAVYALRTALHLRAARRDPSNVRDGDH